jgi:hypothetical protein
MNPGKVALPDVGDVRRVSFRLPLAVVTLEPMEMASEQVERARRPSTHVLLEVVKNLPDRCDAERHLIDSSVCFDAGEQNVDLRHEA